MAEIWRVRADTGGTFTDAWARSPDGRELRCKVLSDGSLVFRIHDRADGGWLDIGEPLNVDAETLIGFSAADASRVLAVREGGRWLQLDSPPSEDRLILRTGEEAPVLAARLLTATPLGNRLPQMDFRVATTRGTNALLEGNGSPAVLFVTRVFADLI